MLAKRAGRVVVQFADRMPFVERAAIAPRPIVVGAGIGCISGYALCAWLATLSKPDGTMALPIAPAEGGYITVFALTTLGAVLASVIPARSAARLDPLEAIQQ